MGSDIVESDLDLLLDLARIVRRNNQSDWMNLLEVLRDGETRSRLIDLVETFAS